MMPPDKLARLRAALVDPKRTATFVAITRALAKRGFGFTAADKLARVRSDGEAGPHGLTPRRTFKPIGLLAPSHWLAEFILPLDGDDSS